MIPDDTKRRLMWHGVLLVLLSGAVVPVVENPRMGLAAHLGGIMDGMLLILLGLIWAELTLPPRMAGAAFWIMLYSAYAGWAAQLLAAVFGTSRAMPLAGTGHVGAEWQEALVLIVVVSFSVAVLIGCGVVLYGLRRNAKSQT
ncbi:MAG: hydrogenase [Planctomycetia bacterium]|nr:hydrogenase [Planctomycetia bacterium]